MVDWRLYKLPLGLSVRVNIAMRWISALSRVCSLPSLGIEWVKWKTDAFYGQNQSRTFSY